MNRRKKMKTFLSIIICLCWLIPVKASDTTDLPDKKLSQQIDIIRKAAAEFKKSGIDTLRGNNNFPVLTGLGKVKLGMSYNNLINALGKPRAESQEYNDLILTYVVEETKILKIGLNKSGQVEYIVTNSRKFKIPNSLYVDLSVNQFENVYGTRRFRQTQRFGLSEDLLIYPLSNLCLVIDPNNQVVKLIMINRN